MTTLSNNRFPKVILTEQASAPTPSPVLVNGEWMLIMKSDNKLYKVDHLGTETEVGGSSGITQTILGYNTVGGTSNAFTQSTYIAKPVTPGDTRAIRSIVMRISGNAAGNIQPMCAIYDDNAGVPGKAVAFGGMTPLLYGLVLSATARWLYMPIFYIPVAATQIWIVAGCIRDAANEVVFYYDTGGGDYQITNTSVVTDGGFSTTSGRNYSIFAVQEG